MDLSGSINENRKNEIETYLMAGYVDESQIKVVKNKAKHSIYSIPFNTSPRAPEKLETLKQTQDYFDRLRARPISAPPRAGTHITAAVIHAYEIIERDQKSGGNLRRANILLITDGVDTIHVEEILQIRQRLNPSLEITLNVISLGEGNPDLQKLATNPERAARLGRYSYQHITYDEIGKILDENRRIQAVETQARIAAVSEERNLKSLTSQDVQKLRQKLVRLMSQNRLGAVRFSEVKRVLALLQSGESQTTSYALDRLFYPFLSNVESNLLVDSSFETKFRMLESFLNQISREYRISSEEVIRQLNVHIRQRVIQVIGFSLSGKSGKG